MFIINNNPLKVNRKERACLKASLMLIGSMSLASLAYGHGDVTPQGLDTEGLPEISKDVLSNPFREDAEHGEYYELAAELGKKGYAGNCANCHGIEAMSGGLTPDLRELTEWDDEYYISRVVNGTGGGMPSFKENLDRTAVWAIKTYVESVQ